LAFYISALTKKNPKVTGREMMSLGMPALNLKKKIMNKNKKNSDQLP
jgi:hypothetical protein